MSDKNLLSGHRERLRRRFIDSPPRSLPDYEILEMVLFQIFPRKNTKDIAKNLLLKYKSIAGVLSAEKSSLKTIDGIGDAVIYQLSLLHDLFSRVYLDVDKKVDILNNWSSVLNYCRFTMAFKETENFRVLYLNSGNALIEDQLCEEGTVNLVNVYPREIIKNAINNNASAIILIHNHPSGNPKPSREDITMTKQISNALVPIDIKLHDHIIVSNSNYYSFRSNGLI